MSVVPFCSVITTTAVLLNLQKVAAEVVADNRRFSALLSEAMSLTDYWTDLTAQPNWTEDHKALKYFDTRLRLFREDTRMFQEELETLQAQRRAADSELPLMLKTGS